MKKTVLLTVLITVIVMFTLMFFAFFMVNGFILHIGDSRVVKQIYKDMQLGLFPDGYHAIGFAIISYLQYLLKAVLEIVGGALVLLLCGVGVYGLFKKRKRGNR